MTIGFETRRCGGGLIPMPNTHATARRIGQARLEHGQQLRKLGAAQAFRATGCLDEGAPSATMGTFRAKSTAAVRATSSAYSSNGLPSMIQDPLWLKGAASRGGTSSERAPAGRDLITIVGVGEVHRQDRLGRRIIPVESDTGQNE